jgi:hypothetical protein
VTDVFINDEPVAVRSVDVRYGVGRLADVTLRLHADVTTHEADE